MTTSEKVIKNKLGLLELSQQLGNVSRAYFSIRQAVGKKGEKVRILFRRGIACLKFYA